MTLIKILYLRCAALLKWIFVNFPIIPIQNLCFVKFEQLTGHNIYRRFEMIMLNDKSISMHCAHLLYSRTQNIIKWFVLSARFNFCKWHEDNNIDFRMNIMTLILLHFGHTTAPFASHRMHDSWPQYCQVDERNEYR